MLEKFEQLMISEPVLRALNDMGFEEPTPIQQEAIPVAMSGKDMIGQAQTGTGKTAAFGLPVLERVDGNERHVQVVILSPTRELAIQVAEELNKMAQYTNITALPIYGGQDINRQFRALKKNPQIIVATPGRLMDHMDRGSIHFDHVKVVVLDEADEMLNMGFVDDINKILGAIPEDHQTLLFSATMPKAIQQLAETYLTEPTLIRMKPTQVTMDLIEQYYIEVQDRQKFDVLCRLFDIQTPELAIIFTRTKRRVDEVTEGLKKRGYMAEGIHGDLSQQKRDSVIRQFREGTIDILVATDVAARGLDISGVSHVYNYDMPQDPESYTHRVGRTGRAGKSGQSITFVSPNEMGYLQIIENLTKKRMKGLKPASAEEAFQAKKQVALKKIERDFADETIRGNFEKFGKDARKLAAEFTPEELAMYILSLTVQDPDSLPEVEIAREKPLPFKPSGNGFGGNAKGGRRGDDRRDNRRGDNRRGGRRDDFKKGSRGNDRFDKEKRYRKDNKKPRNTSSEKQTGFVIRNKGDK